MHDCIGRGDIRDSSGEELAAFNLEVLAYIVEFRLKMPLCRFVRRIFAYISRRSGAGI